MKFHCNLSAAENNLIESKEIYEFHTSYGFLTKFGSNDYEIIIF